MNKDFENKYIDLDLQSKHWWFVVRQKIVEDLLHKFLALNDNPPKVLDFGCSSGGLVQYLQKLNYNAFGCDVSEEAIKTGRQKNIANLTSLKENHLNFRSEFFDGVLALDVLEHLEDESWAINEIQRVLAPGGVAVIMVPAFRFLWGIQDEVAHHFRRYTMAQLLERVSQAKRLTVLRKTYFNSLLFFPIVAVRLLTRWLKIRNRESDFEINNKLTNSVFSWIFKLERRLLNNVDLPFGVSILLVLRKNG